MQQLLATCPLLRRVAGIREGRGCRKKEETQLGSAQLKILLLATGTQYEYTFRPKVPDGPMKGL